jgi:3-deoxy-D-manno-octulosonate 8-phosphate phosphatase (KDO 8-P phosphatase)
MIEPAAAKRVRLLGLDVDGVLTDNGIFLGPVHGERVELKRFDIQDGLGHVLMRAAEIPVVWVSGRFSEATLVRARELEVVDVLQVRGPEKLEALGDLLDRRGISWDEAAFVATIWPTCGSSAAWACRSRWPTRSRRSRRPRRT